MFDNYKDGQPVAVSIFEKAIKEDKLSHAYLIDTNNYSNAFEFILMFVKAIICSNIKNSDEINNVCKRIDDGNYLELKVIESDGAWIKKEQMMELQDNFSLKGLEGSKRIYIIKDCDKMNVQTSNSILKFLEEPADNIIAILMTNNVSKLLDTIISRCQFVRLNSDKKIKNRTIENLADIVCSTSIENEKFLNDEKNEFIIDSLLNFVKRFEECGISIIVDIKKLWHNIFDSRELVEIALDLWINLYYDTLLYKSELDVCFFVDYVDFVKEISNINSISNILNKLSVLINSKSILKFNLNLNLFIDKLVIDMVGDS